MKQFIQHLSSGLGEVRNIPAPALKAGRLLIKSHCSLLSAGTERMLVNFAQSNLLEKAKQQPDKVKQVLEKVKTDGFINTFDSVKSKLEQPIPLGYSNVGEVLQIGAGVKGFNVGDRVVSNGSHAELVLVPQNLCALIPDEVNDEEASFTVLASIALQGIRLVEPTLGETFLVSGLGLIGLLTSQLLVSQNCKVLGIDPDPKKCYLAKSLGIETLCLEEGSDPLNWCLDYTGGLGVDGALITASTSSSEPIHLAANACRQRGRIVLIGVTGCDLRRDLFYKKELSFQVSCSYGPGRYDVNYEEQGQDYPIGFVRWTEQRNFQAILNSLAKGLIKTDILISSRYDFDNAPEAYTELLNCSSSLGIIFTYKENKELLNKSVEIKGKESSRFIKKSLEPNLGFIGAGNYAGRSLIPAFAKTGANFSCIAALSGLNPYYIGNKFNFKKATTDLNELINDPEINAIIISTRHNSHCDLICRCLRACKHVFVEKPLCLNTEQLNLIKSTYTGRNILMVGFNRRFSPLIMQLKKRLESKTGPKAFVYTCNAGAIPFDHWTQDPDVGGGRLMGEACHFLDILRFLADSSILDVYLTTIPGFESCSDTFSLQIKFFDGSIGSIHYFSNGSNSFPKERLEVFVSGNVFCLDNYRKLKAWGVPGFVTKRSFSQDKGQFNCAQAFLNALDSKKGQPPIPVEQLFEVQAWLNKVLKK